MTLVAENVAIESTASSNAQAAESKPLRVACVGDSITYGFGIADRERDCYPACLAKMLGDGYAVRNFGVNGATLLKRGTRPYSSQDVFDKALAFRPDIVVIQLGTNDTNPQTWPEHGDDFVDDYVALIDSFRGVNANARILVCLPPPIFRDRGKAYDTDAILQWQILPQIKAVENRRSVAVIDVEAALKDQSKWFPDGVHPNSTGARVIAETVRRALAKSPLTHQATGK